MSKQTFNLFERQAIWEAHSKKCAYCGEHVSFARMEIDHIIAEHLSSQPDKWEKVRLECGLPFDFDLNGWSNLVPSCRPCNQRKADIPLPCGRAVIEIGQAKKKINKIKDLISRFQAKDTQERARLYIAKQLELGVISQDEVASLLNSPIGSKASFVLTRPVVGEKSILEISRDDIKGLLDEIISFSPGMMSSLRLVSEEKEPVYVNTLRQFRDAVANGYYPLSNAEMQTSYSYFERPLDVLDAVEAASIAERSYIDAPSVGVTDLALLPTELITRTDWMTDDPAFQRSNLENHCISVQDLVNCHRAHIVEMGDGLLVVDGPDGLRTFIFEIMRADFDGDGIQDLMIHYGLAAIHGSYRSARTIWLTRLHPNAMFSRIDRPLAAWKQANQNAVELAELRKEVAALKAELVAARRRWWHRWLRRQAALYPA